MFPNMLGLVKGRVYYNLINWYRLIAMLPGFSVNRRFMEQMMGVKEGLPESIVSDLDRATTVDRLRDAVRLGGTLAGIVRHHLTMGRSIRRFHQRLREALDSLPPALVPHAPRRTGEPLPRPGATPAHPLGCAPV